MKRTTSGVFIAGLVLALFLCLVRTPSVRQSDTKPETSAGASADRGARFDLGSSNRGKRCTDARSYACGWVLS